MSTIVALEATNVKRLRAISIKPDGSLVIVGGANGNGKTSLLDSIAFALGGKDVMQSEPLRRGADKGQVIVTLDDGMVVKRTFTPGGGGTLTVSNKDGARFPSPQALLDRLVGKLSFDPLQFSRMDSKAQASTLRQLVGIDTAAIEAKRKAAYDQRTDVSREVKRLQGALDTLPAAPEGTPDKEVSIDELAAELQRRQAVNAEKTKAERLLDAKRAEAIATRKRVADIEEQLATALAAVDQIIAEGKQLAEQTIAMPFADEAEIIDQLKNAQAINASVRAATEHRKLAAELDAQQSKAMELTVVVQKADDEKREALAAAKIPIEGIAFDESGMTLNGLPLDQASSAEQLRASVAIGLAMHPKLKVLLVRDGSLLDEKSLAMVAEMSEQAGAQVWLEKVSSTGEGCQVVIEDGMVANSDKPPSDANKSARRMRESGED
jgi:hypothetical protein